eukprot:Protomagalhaensia_sp_Gyna_25__1457@NODE_173_length_4650_cov_21_775103_g135_i0_p2_GENE_NODE_173_length_4650_cov_21_775103_g135_i0NODE_173_length_4650_cov_21_775103_g135_i0_p2_ORF_typecomplete_len255_score36_83Thioredoxin/PF00085_20/2_3e13Thioredoxin_2/PF13098_6/0_00021Thioredoxin_2/PF13098_6/5_2e03Thioredoxin_7/PF13899_6/4_3e03Thioredoxin_7/PF13899_6/0_0018Phosducin/PF02114_16/0_001OST3_OST6/PF04756_13/0_0027Thioredoxin_9/PF14595_6/0_0031Thioredoxin_8/PF13905_6/4_5e03Thioredoxin_8/PF13905_6/0_012
MALEEIASKPSTREPFAFATVSRRDYVDTFANVLSDGFLQYEFPAVLLLDVIDGYKKFMVRLEEHFDMKNLGAIDKDLFAGFIHQQILDPYRLGTLKPYLRSETLEEDPDAVADPEFHALKAINSTFFHEHLMKGKAEPDFFVVFYAPWCGHCRRFHELFRPLARLVRSKTQQVGFYKMDSTKNDIDHPTVAIARVPHVRFFRRGHYEEPLVFDHRAKEVTEENLKTFLTAHSRAASQSVWRQWRVGETNLDEL